MKEQPKEELSESQKAYGQRILACLGEKATEEQIKVWKSVGILKGDQYV